MRSLLALAIVAFTSVPAAAQQSNPRRDSLIARAKALELNTPYVPPPGTALEHHAAGFAQIMCSAVFITGLDPDFAAENVGYFTAPYAERAKLGKPIIDRAGKAVHVTLPNGVRRTAKFVGDQGCVTLPLGRSSLNFKPIRVASVLPDPSTQAWPMGDLLPTDPLAPELDTAAIRAAVDTAFQPGAAMTAAFVVTWKGRIIGERYGAGITARTPLESWSMGKSLTAALLGILIKQGVYALEQPAPIPEWQGENDPRAARSGFRSIRPLSRSPVSVHGRREPIPLRRHSPAPMATGHRRPLPQHRPGAGQLPHSSGRREAWRGVPLVSATGAVGQNRHPVYGDGNRPVWEFPDAGIRAGVRP